MSSNFTIQPLLNKSEARVFKELARIVIGCNPDWQVMAQVSLGEILRIKDAEAYSCINSKRVDLLLVDGNCQPRHAIEIRMRRPRAMRSRTRPCNAPGSATRRSWPAKRRHRSFGDWSRTVDKPDVN
jgi:hypothetical protein